MKLISLRRFRDHVPTLTEVTEVAMRDPEGNIRLLGYWTPYATISPDAEPLKPLRKVVVK